ncbi:MAG: biotin--[acetyl-CoA-carboxylase] ligase [Clostridia bacterium]|nr:biotin--[acetyl-CoA-carboxylase] ligase [Clostridia bacterium]
MKWIKFDEIPSTNDYVKSIRDGGEDVIVTAKRQTGGRGTKGRSFSSEEGGVYLSTLRFYKDFLAKDAFKIMSGAAVAVCETLRFFGLTPVIKWSNDIYVNGKKICGILIENTLSGKNISSSIVGVGLNVNTLFCGELSDIATSMLLESGKSFSVEEVTKKLIEELFKERTMEEYRAYLGFMGERVTLISGDERVPATLLFVDDEGRLTAEINGERRVFSSAEVSVRIC